MACSLMQHGVGQLEELFTKSKSDSKVLKQLEHELQYRQVPRAVALLAEVQAAMYGLSPGLAPTPAVKSPPSVPQPSLWDSPASTVRPAAPPPPAVTAPVAPRSAETAAPVRPAISPSPVIPLDDAYKLLKATPGSTWESIEQTRRLLVQVSHPEKVRTLPEARRSHVLAEAKMVNEAYAALSQARCAGR